MDWVLIVFTAFKFLLLGAGMYFCVKWHYDQEEKGKGAAALRFSAAVFVLSLLGVGLFAFVLIRMLGLDLSFP